MSWLTELKKFLNEPDKEKKVEKKIEKVTFQQINSIVEEKFKADMDKKEEFRKMLVERIERFEKEQIEAVKILRNFDLNKRKEQEKLKLVVADNYNLYCTLIERLLKDLSGVKGEDLEILINKTYFIINEFSRKSYEPYEKANILIGEEMVSTKRIVGEFVRDLNKLVEENKAFFDELTYLNKIREIIDEIKKGDEYYSNIELEIKVFNDELDKIKNEILQKESSIKNIENSYKFNSDKEEKIKKDKAHNELLSEIDLIKKKIDFKALSRVFHLDEKKNNLIKEYSNNFKLALKNDSNLEIVSFVKTAQNIDVDRLAYARRKLIDMDNPFLTESDRKIMEIKNEIEKMNLDLAYRESSVAELIKKREKLKEKKENLQSSVGGLVPKVFDGLELVNSNA